MSDQLSFMDYTVDRTGQIEIAPDWMRKERCENCKHWHILPVEEQPPAGWGVRGQCNCYHELKIELTEGDSMKFKHTYCFYMTNGEHLMIDADDITIRNYCIEVRREKDRGMYFMVIYKKDLMAWEVSDK